MPVHHIVIVYYQGKSLYHDIPSAVDTETVALLLFIAFLHIWEILILNLLKYFSSVIVKNMLGIFVYPWIFLAPR